MTLDEEKEYYAEIDYSKLDNRAFLANLADMIDLHMYHMCKHGHDWKLSELLYELEKRLEQGNIT